MIMEEYQVGSLSNNSSTEMKAIMTIPKIMKVFLSNTETNIASRMARYIKASGEDHRGMAMASRCGLMELDMKGNGGRTKRMGEESSGMLTEMCLMGNGNKTKLTDTVCTRM